MGCIVAKIWAPIPVESEAYQPGRGRALQRWLRPFHHLHMEIWEFRDVNVVHSPAFKSPA